MKATQCGVNMNLQNPNVKFFTREYVNAKYDGVEPKVQRVVLHPYFQINMQNGHKLKDA